MNWLNTNALAILAIIISVASFFFSLIKYKNQFPIITKRFFPSLKNAIFDVRITLPTKDEQLQITDCTLYKKHGLFYKEFNEQKFFAAEVPPTPIVGHYDIKLHNIQNLTDRKYKFKVYFDKYPMILSIKFRIPYDIKIPDKSHLIVYS